MATLNHNNHSDLNIIRILLFLLSNLLIFCMLLYSTVQATNVLALQSLDNKDAFDVRSIIHCNYIFETFHTIQERNIGINGYTSPAMNLSKSNDRVVLVGLFLLIISLLPCTSRTICISTKNVWQIFKYHSLCRWIQITSTGYDGGSKAIRSRGINMLEMLQCGKQYYFLTSATQTVADILN